MTDQKKEHKQCRIVNDKEFAAITSRYSIHDTGGIRVHNNK